MQQIHFLAVPFLAGAVALAGCSSPNPAPAPNWPAARLARILPSFAAPALGSPSMSSP